MKTFMGYIKQAWNSCSFVVNCKGASVSVAAMIKGYLDFDKNRIEAVVLNNVSKHV